MDHVKPLLSAFLDAELEVSEQGRVAAHLAECRLCREECDDLRALSLQVASLPARPLPPGFLRRLRESARPPVFPAWRPAAFAAAGTLAAFGLYFFGANPRPLAVPMAEEARAAAEPEAPLVVVQSAPPPRQIYTNETLHALQEEEKRRMGIVKIIRPSEAQRAARRVVGAENVALGRLPSAAPVSGERPLLLSYPASRGAALEEPAFDELSADGEGAVMRSRRGALSLWKRLGLAGELPAIDFSAEMLVAVFPGENAPMEIYSVKSEEGRLFVLYRPRSAQSGPDARPYRVVPLTDLPVQFVKTP